MGLCKSLKILMIMSLLCSTGSFYSRIVSAEGTDAVGGMKYLLGSHEDNDASSDIPENNDDVESSDVAEPGEGKEDDSKKQTGCGPESLIPVEVCELGQGLLCLNSPPFSIDDELVIVKGTVDRKTSTFSHIRVYSQHEYTKIFNEVIVNEWASGDCREDDWAEEYDGCMDMKGYFAVKVPLSEKGPYIIMVDEVSLDGSAVSKTVRTSRVVAPGLSSSDITIIPDPSESGGMIDATKVRLTVDMLHDCSFCDFIGTSTGGLMISVNNIIHTEDGDTVTITRRGNSATAGKFDICVPVLPGTNEFTVSACNAAIAEDCPKVKIASFNVKFKEGGIDIISPDTSKLIYESAGNSVIPLKFSIKNYVHEEGCKDGDVVVSWNRHDPVSLCPDGNGHYQAHLVPDVGINVGTIEAVSGDNKVSESFIVGWGDVQNPFVDDEGWIKSGLGIAVGSEYINDTTRLLVNDFLNSENFNLFISDLFSLTSPTSGDGEKDESQVAEKVAKIKEEIKYCDSGGGFGDMQMKLVGDPVIGSAEVERFEFRESEIGFGLYVKGLEAHLQLFNDKNKDGVPDDTILPLKIAFRGARFQGKIKIEAGDKPKILITSDNTNCDYQSGTYCEKKPALLIPKNIAGGATKGGAIVRCDDQDQKISDAFTEKCIGLNIMNAQTGILNEKVLDAINDMAYCQGSAYLTYLLREGLEDIPFHPDYSSNGVESDSDIMSVLFQSRSMWFSGGIRPLDGEIKIDKSGIKMAVPVRVGGKKIADKIDSRAFDSNVGIFTGANSAGLDFSEASDNSMSLSVPMSIINEMLFQLAFQKEGSGIFDWMIDEPFFNKLGFDFVKECDEFDPFDSEQGKPSVLCELRPNVLKLLGISLSTAGYFSNKHPIRLEIKGSREIAPHIKLYKDEVPFELPPEEGDEEIKYDYKLVDLLELQIPDLDVAFFALKVDESLGLDVYENPMILLDKNGEPEVKSMIDGSSEPVPILRVKMTILFAVEIGSLQTASDDPSQFVLSVRPIPQFMKIVFKEEEGGNSTIIPVNNMLSALMEKINYGVSEFGNVDKSIKLKLPKSIPLDFLEDMDTTDMFSEFGLEKVSLGKEGLVLGLDHKNQKIEFTLKPVFEQNLF